MDLGALLRDPAATPSPAPAKPQGADRPKRPAGALVIAAGGSDAAVAPRKAADLRKSLWKNRGRDGKVGRKEEANVDRKQRRLEAMGDRRPGLQAAAQDVQDEEEEEEVAVGGRMNVKDRLAKFKADRAARRAMEKAKSKQPFRVGIYKLDGRFPPPSTEKMGQIPAAVKSAAFKGKRLQYTTPANRVFTKQQVSNAFKEVPVKRSPHPSLTKKGPKPKLNLVAEKTRLTRGRQTVKQEPTVKQEKRTGRLRNTQPLKAKAKPAVSRGRVKAEEAPVDNSKHVVPDIKISVPVAKAEKETRRSTRSSVKEEEGQAGTLGVEAPKREGGLASLEEVEEAEDGDLDAAMPGDFEGNEVPEMEVPKPEASPIRRSRRISEMKEAAQELVVGQPEVLPATPKRRSKRVSTKVKQSDAAPSELPAATPTRRSRRISTMREAAELHVEPPQPPVATPQRRSKRVSERTEEATEPDFAQPKKPAATPARRSMRIAEQTSLTPALQAMTLSTNFGAPNPFANRFTDAGGHLPKLDLTFGNVVDKTAKDSQKDEAPVAAPEKPKETPAAPPADGVDKVYQFRATSSPKRDADGFATPEAPVSRRRTRRGTTYMTQVLLDPLRHDVLHRRGSTSEKRRAARRRRNGGAGTPGGVNHDWRAELVEGIPDDESSPLHNQLSSIFNPNDKSDKSETLTEDQMAKIIGIVGSCERPSKPKVAAASSQAMNAHTLCFVDEDEPKGVAHFRTLLRQTGESLEELCGAWEAKLGEDLPEEAVGGVRSAIGKARLLTNAKGRMEQFRGLVDNCEFGTGDKPTTCTDLQGFWDMIAFQVEDVKQLFADLVKLESNNWVRAEESVARVKEAPRKTKKTTTFKRKDAGGGGKKENAAASKSRLALRQMIAAGRRELAAASTDDKKEEELEAVPSPSTSSRRKSVLLDVRTPNSVLRPVNRAMEKVFDGGFFAVRSPSRGPGEWTDFPDGQEENM